MYHLLAPEHACLDDAPQQTLPRVILSRIQRRGGRKQHQLDYEEQNSACKAWGARAQFPGRVRLDMHAQISRHVHLGDVQHPAKVADHVLAQNRRHLKRQLDFDIPKSKGFNFQIPLQFS